MDTILTKLLFRLIAAIFTLCGSLSAQASLPSFAGTYQGLLADSQSDDPLGRIDFIVTSTGALSGTLSLKDQKSYKFRTALSFDATNDTASFTNLDVVNPKAGLELKLSVEIAEDGSFVVNGNALLPAITANFTEADGTTARLRLFQANECPWAGTYTMAFHSPTTRGGSTPPGGASIGTASIKTDGVMAVKGTLADGTKISTTARPSADGTYRIYFSPHKTVGSYFLAIFKLEERTDGKYQVDEDQSIARWFKAPNSKDKAYRHGFDASYETLVAEWVAPAKGQSLRDLLGFGGTKIIEIDFINGFSPITYAGFLPTSLGLNENNTFRIASTLSGPNVTDQKAWAKIFSGKVDPKTGWISISINISDLVNGKPFNRKVVVNGIFAQLGGDSLNKPYAFGHLLIPPLDARTQTLTSGGFTLPGPFFLDTSVPDVPVTGGTAGNYSAVLTMLEHPTPMPSGVPAHGSTVSFSISSNLKEMTFAGRKIQLIGDSRPVSLSYSDATKTPTKNLTVTVYLNGSGVVSSLATQYFEISGTTVRVRNHTSNTVSKR